MTKQEFFDFFLEMKPQKYYEPASLDLPKAQVMINNTDNNYFAMQKHDGEWAMLIYANDTVHIKSRSISKVTGTYGDKTYHVPHIVEEVKKYYPEGTVLLGELAFSDITKTSRDVGTILRCLAPKAIERQKTNPLHFYIFDVLAYNYTMLWENDFDERYIPYYINKVHDSNYIHGIMSDSGQDADFMEFAEYILSKGGEGIMIIKKDTPYAPGKRTAWNSLKVKKNLGEITAPIVNFLEPNRVYEGTEIRDWKFYEFELEDGSVYKKDISDSFDQIPAGLDPVQYEDGYIKKYTNLKIVKAAPVTKPYYYGWKSGVTINYKGKEIKVASGMTDEYRAWLASDAALELLNAGKLTATITGMELTADGSVRHPVLLKINK